MRKRRKLFAALLVIFVVAVAAGVGVSEMKGRDVPYQSIQKDGFSGTREQLLAALVGELCIEEPIPEEQSAFYRACQMGYRGSYESWCRVLTGEVPGEDGISMYKVLLKSGYEKGIEAWLESLVQDTETLGKSTNTESLTEYELACQYGFEGTFIQWLVSLAGYDIENNDVDSQEGRF